MGAKEILKLKGAAAMEVVVGGTAVREAICNGEGGGATDAGVVAGGEVGDGGATVNNDATDEESFASPALI